MLINSNIIGYILCDYRKFIVILLFYIEFLKDFYDFWWFLFFFIMLMGISKLLIWLLIDEC